MKVQLMITAISSCVGDYLLHVIVWSRNVVLIFTRFHASVSNRTPVSQTGHPLYATPNDTMLCRKCASTPDSGCSDRRLQVFDCLRVVESVT